MGYDQTSDILSRHLDADFRATPLARAAVSAAQLQAVATRFGVKFPQAYADHVCGRFPAIYVEVREAVWPRPQPHAVAPFWSFLYAVHTYTPAPDSDDWMRLDAAAEQLRAGTGLSVVPILRVIGDADVFCVDAAGAIVRFRHEENLLEPVALDFWQLFESEISALRERRDRKRAEAVPR